MEAPQVEMVDGRKVSRHLPQEVHGQTNPLRAIQ